MAELVDALASGASVRKNVEVRTASRQFGNGLSGESYAFDREIRGSRNVTKSFIIILEPIRLDSCASGGIGRHASLRS